MKDEVSVRVGSVCARWGGRCAGANVLHSLTSGRASGAQLSVTTRSCLERATTAHRLRSPPPPPPPPTPE